MSRLTDHIDTNLTRLGTYGTRFVNKHWGERLRQVVVAEFPKSGGTWLCRMLADYLQIPFAQHYRLPIAMRAVIHSHWNYNKRLSNCVYLYRDGRDVMVSLYFHRMRGIHEPRTRNHPFNRMMGRRYTQLLGADYDWHDTRRSLPAIIDVEMRRPRSARTNWPTHVRQWMLRDHSNVTGVSYESLLTDGLSAMTALLQGIGVESVDADQLQASINRYSFERMTGRKPGQEDRGSFVRKGVAGDWVNHFSREAAEMFDRWAGEELIALGYEPDRSWIDRTAH